MEKKQNFCQKVTLPTRTSRDVGTTIHYMITGEENYTDPSHYIR